MDDPISNPISDPISSPLSSISEQGSSTDNPEIVPRKKTIGRTESSSTESGKDMKEAKQRLSISGIRTEKISLNLEGGYFTSAEVFKALTTEKPDTSKLITLSFDSEKEMEDYILGKTSEEERYQPVLIGEGAKPSSESDVSTIRSRASIADGGHSSKKTVLEGILALEKGSGRWKEKTWGLTQSSFGYYRKIAPLIRSRQYVDLIKLMDIREVYHDEHCFILDENCFSVETNDQKFFFKARTRGEMASWMVAIARQRNALQRKVL